MSSFRFRPSILCQINFWILMVYALISSSLVLMTGLIISWVNVIVLCCVPKKILNTMEYYRCHNICCNAIYCDWTCDWMSQLFMFIHMLLCLDSISLPYWLGIIRSSLTTRYNWFLPIYLRELSLIPYFLFLITFNCLEYDFLSITSTWNMVEDTPNHIPNIIIG